MSKISELTDGGSLLPTDFLIAVRSGGNVKVQADDITVDQINLGDNEFIRLGNSQDLTMVHTSTQSIINQAGIGDLLIQKAGATKLTINASGIDVTGSVTADGLTVDGNPVINGTSPQLFLQTGASNTNWQIAAQENVANAFEISSGAADASAPDDTYTPRLVILNTGNVGIGTSSVATKLHVMGNSTVRNTTVSTLTLDAGISAANPYTNFGTGIDFKGRDYSNAIRNYGGIYSIMVGNTSPTTPAGDPGFTSALTFNTNTGGASGTNPTEKMRIDGSGNVIVGGTTAQASDAVTLLPDGEVTAAGFYFSNNIGAAMNDTGIRKATTSTMVFDTASTERMRLDASGNVGIGGSPLEKLHVNSTSGDARIGLNAPTGSDTEIKFFNNGIVDYTIGHDDATDNFVIGTANVDTPLLSVTKAGNVGIGTSSPDSPLEIQAATNSSSDTTYLKLYNAGENVGNIDFENGNGSLARITGTKAGTGASANDGILYFSTAFDSSLAERMRIDSSGNLLVGVTTPQSFSGVTAAQNFVTPTNGHWAAGFRNTTAVTPWGVAIEYTGANPNNTSSDFLYCSTTGGLRFAAMSNGGIKNYQANDLNLSDRREKTNFSPAKSYLDAICAIPVQTFNYIDQNMEDDPSVTLGVVAQDVQTVAPELVTEANWGTEEDPKMRLSIYQTDLQYALMKCIQEQQATIEALTARIAALES